MDAIDSIIARFRAEPRHVPAPKEQPNKSRLLDELKSELLRAQDTRIESFLLELIADSGEYDLARVHAIEMLHLFEPCVDPAKIGSVLRDVVVEDTDPDVRTWAALELAPFVNLDGVYTSKLTDVILDSESPHLVRMNLLLSVFHGRAAERCKQDLQRIAALAGREDLEDDDGEVGQLASDILSGKEDELWGRR